MLGATYIYICSPSLILSVWQQPLFVVSASNLHRVVAEIYA